MGEELERIYVASIMLFAVIFHLYYTHILYIYIHSLHFHLACACNIVRNKKMCLQIKQYIHLIRVI